MAALNDKEIINSWQINAKPWIKAIESQEIESRKVVTNQAIIDLIKSKQPETLLDIGCGEGWLERALADEKLMVYGIDVVPDLIKKAGEETSGIYRVCKYEEMASHDFGRLFDCIVCNFSLIGNESTESVFRSAKNLLKNEKSGFIIQTLHPVIACGDQIYQDGWREGSWAGFSNEFSNPAPWYFRTISSWSELFSQADLQLEKIHEPLNPKTGKPASIIFEATSKT